MDDFEAARQFVNNPANELKCDACPHNNDFSAWPGHRLPCGQFKCWVTVQCEHDEDDD